MLDGLPMDGQAMVDGWAISGWEVMMDGWAIVNGQGIMVNGWAMADKQVTSGCTMYG